MTTGKQSFQERMKSEMALAMASDQTFASSIKDGALHYTACGLDDVWLLNGFTIEQTPYGEGVSIEDADGLHRSLARAIIRQKTMSPKEVRFLRKLMGLSQKGLGELLGQTDQTMARWEKGQHEMDPSAERLLRFIVADWLKQEFSVRVALRQLSEQDEIEHADRRMTRLDDHWQDAA